MLAVIWLKVLQTERTESAKCVMLADHAMACDVEWLVCSAQLFIIDSSQQTDAVDLCMLQASKNPMSMGVLLQTIFSSHRKKFTLRGKKFVGKWLENANIEGSEPEDPKCTFAINWDIIIGIFVLTAFWLSYNSWYLDSYEAVKPVQSLDGKQCTYRALGRLMALENKKLLVSLWNGLRTFPF